MREVCLQLQDSTFPRSIFEENKMSSSPNYVCCHRNRLLVVLLFLLVSSLTQVTFMAAEGRSLSRLLEAAQKETEEEDKPFMMRSLIGSRPPRCERKCSSWPNCEAIQVPVTTLFKNRRDRHFSAALFSISFSRGDDISNYKPMSWKCKCGNLICNP
ncbi:hypothetical protein ES332_D05G235700v1 [Gossypium tomentosum]|uniref:Epidermal patterning factor-like protein n=2 Tax=Gossypium tomentosum TaxID=34277 RepID=A0A5D2KZD1_GOSTO|nr:hypothetical protein ES332_D05G235700v1 [Gossypium tomentosum]